MLHFPFQSPQSTHLLLQLKLKKPPSSSSGSSTSSNRFKISYKSPITSTNSAMTNIGCHISFRWATNFGCTCRKNALQDPIGSFAHSIMVCTLSPRLWGIIILSSTFLYYGLYTINKAMGDNPWPTPSVQCVSNSPLFPTIIGHLRSRRTIDTKRDQPQLHTTGIQVSDCGETGQGHSTTKDPTLSSRQSRATPAPRQVVQLGPSSTEISSSNGGPQCNGDHCFLRRED
jgi:hypothetical protein